MFVQGFALALAAQLPPAAPVAQAPQTGDAIVVTGIRLQDYRAALAACLARGCPPDEDIDATLALAEAEFLSGEYQGARRTIADSLDRNRGHAAAYPEPVADLHRSAGRVSRHLGLDDEARRAVYGILDSLRQGIPQEDHRHFGARLEISEHLVAVGRHRSAQTELGRLARIARAAGREDVATMAEMRRLWVSWLEEPRGPARRRLVELSRETAPDRRLSATAATILLARIHRAEGDAREADALIARLGRVGGGAGAQRRLLHSPEYEFSTRLVGDTPDTIRVGSTTARTPDNYDNKWIDVGFWVQPDGTVSGLEILRRGASADWARPLLASIRGRLYSPAAAATYRVERYTYTAGYQVETGTRIARRSPMARAEYLDLTDGEAPPPPGPAARD
jgi:hypothetical protein